MTFKIADRVKETCSAPGTGTVTLLGAVAQFLSWSSQIGANNTAPYVIADASGTNWEVGIGTVGSTGTTLARTTILASSNSGLIVNFSSGTQYVWCDLPASLAVLNGYVQTPAIGDNSQNVATTAFIQRALGNVSGVQNASSSFTLSNAYAGQIISVTSNLTITLGSSGWINGQSVQIYGNGGVATINCTGGAAITSYGITTLSSLTVPSGSSVTLTFDGNSSFIIQKNDIGNNLYSLLSNPSVSYANLVSKSQNTWYVAAKTGFVSVYLLGSYINSATAYVGTSTTNYTAIQAAGDDINNNTKGANFSFPVRAGDYYYIGNPSWNSYAFEQCNIYEISL